MRIAGIESAIRVAEKYKEIRANMGKGVDKGLEKTRQEIWNVKEKNYGWS